MTHTPTTPSLKKLEKIAKALGDVNRLKILNLIASRGGIGACAAVQECVELAQPSVSHHIKILIEAGLIDAHKEGRTYHYSLNRATLQEYMQSLSEQTKLTGLTEG
ncbi:ArsR/SmtB family transcription factor [Cesiribacter andamanensis]|uniref:Arsenical resistance operon repressor n=1 Tax=Cesiribacter andamanensis AMV16 TaxID=1279009 RepID=M7NRT2_9BACT|nr:metalloregulator ArsR/SmtB family transcription factor [Cesiribacter andamanensis]EMR01199.1 Arsenical resistance operon repressor [Cesiribacter andamanensis AMV16]